MTDLTDVLVRLVEASNAWTGYDELNEAIGIVNASRPGYVAPTPAPVAEPAAVEPQPEPAPAEVVDPTPEVPTA